MIKKSQVVSEDSEAKLLEVALSRQDRLLILLGLDSGLRLGEVAALNVNSIVATPGASGDIYIGSLAVSKSHELRKFFLSDRTAAAWREHVAGIAGSEEVPVFSTKQGTRADSRLFAHRFRKLCQEAVVEPVGFHVLRRTFGFRLASGGCSPLITAKLLGCSVEWATEFYR